MYTLACGCCCNAAAATAGNYELYRRPVTSAQDIGEWNKDEPLRDKEPWTYVRRRVHLDSEMTRYLAIFIRHEW